MAARLALAFACLALALSALCFWRENPSLLSSGSPRAPSTAPLKTVGYDLLDVATVQARLFRIPVTTVVESSTYGEDGLVGGNATLRDTDALVPQWTHQEVYLPGNRADVYQFDGCIQIAGSGLAALFLTPTHQNFALLHMATCALQGISAAPTFRYRGPHSHRQDDVTGLAYSALLKAQNGVSVGVRDVTGGTFIGYSGWPSSYEFSNGSCASEATCGIDAHLCEIDSAGASAWFLWLAEGHDTPLPKPPPFPLKRWNAYTRSHHLRSVPAYHAHHLRPEARFWRSHQWLGGVKHEEIWHAKAHLEVMPFAHGSIDYFPRTRRLVAHHPPKGR